MHENINWISVLVSSLSSLFIGFVWYNPKVFGTIWMKAAKVEPDAGKNANMPVIFITTYLMSVVVCYYIAGRIHPDEHLSPFIHGAFHGLRLSAFIAIPFIVINSLFEMRGLKYILITAGYVAVTLAVMSGILFIWPV